MKQRSGIVDVCCVCAGLWYFWWDLETMQPLLMFNVPNLKAAEVGFPIAMDIVESIPLKIRMTPNPVCSHVQELCHRSSCCAFVASSLGLVWTHNDCVFLFMFWHFVVRMVWMSTTCSVNQQLLGLYLDLKTMNNWYFPLKTFLFFFTGIKQACVFKSFAYSILIVMIYNESGYHIPCITM